MRGKYVSSTPGKCLPFIESQMTLVHHIKISFAKAEQTTAQAMRMINKIDRLAVNLLSIVNH